MKSQEQTAVMWVVRTACVVFVVGVLCMAYMGIRGIAIPDQFDRLVNLAGVGALALLGRITDTKREASEAAEKMINDLASLAPQPVEVVDTERNPIHVTESNPLPPPPIKLEN